ncbi:alkaline phosphatase PhoX [Stakelama saccharophila]|uniref:DUF839 domain-containing protein n=1 Tax=Stakelama saccharophila TaxID=3075605 RepID=A0ABZ0B4V6_9SPHN|nr:alkaline phosphatase PhoX [Stakelama sp. W311]WNO52417.1 DUF839 domain-containing protein [Stakelama sp. W311]
MDRRQFSRGAITALAFAGLARGVSAWARQDAVGEDGSRRFAYRNQVPGYGPLKPDPVGLLDLPEGFSYRIVSQLGDRMDDGFRVPDSADGMGAFDLGGGRIALVRNHELDPDELPKGPAGTEAGRLHGLAAFDHDGDGHALPGGTTTLVLDAATLTPVRQHLSLAGTVRNCAGGTTPWGSWLSCEETVDRCGKAHGWVFEVPAAASGPVEPVPLTAMGRFRHEAAAVDPRTGIVYMTEDRDESLFYRFLPDVHGELARGGRLQALGLADAPEGFDTRNWNHVAFPSGTTRAVRWIDLDGVGSPDDDLRHRGHEAGAALFARGEGVHWGDGELYFCCTSGGAAGLGQVMRYVPSAREGQAGERDAPGRLTNFVESTDPRLFNFGDNLTVSPWGHLIVCEDQYTDITTNHLRGVTPDGKLYTLARHGGQAEFAGACFSPDGRTLFVNIYHPAKTLAITGPWI